MVNNDRNLAKALHSVMNVQVVCKGSHRDQQAVVEKMQSDPDFIYSNFLHWYH